MQGSALQSSPGQLIDEHMSSIIASTAAMLTNVILPHQLMFCVWVCASGQVGELCKGLPADAGRWLTSYRKVTGQSKMHVACCMLHASAESSMYLSHLYVHGVHVRHQHACMLTQSECMCHTTCVSWYILRPASACPCCAVLYICPAVCAVPGLYGAVPGLHVSCSIRQRP